MLTCCRDIQDTSCRQVDSSRRHQKVSESVESSSHDTLSFFDKAGFLIVQSLSLLESASTCNKTTMIIPTITARVAALLNTVSLSELIFRLETRITLKLTLFLRINNKKAQLMLAYPRNAKTKKKIPPFRSYSKFQSSRKSGVYSN